MVFFAPFGGRARCVGGFAACFGRFSGTCASGLPKWSWSVRGGALEAEAVGDAGVGPHDGAAPGATSPPGRGAVRRPPTLGGLSMPRRTRVTVVAVWRCRIRLLASPKEAIAALD